MIQKPRQSYLSEARVWCRGRRWQWRILFLFWFAYVFIRHLASSEYQSILGPLNLGIHEFGHLIFMPFGQFMHMLGGTLFQIAAPVLAVFNFYRQKDFFSISLCFGWLSTNLFDISRYAADARRMSIPLVSPFGAEAIHDWNYLLVRMRWLQHDALLAEIFKGAAVLSMLACLIFGSWLLWHMMVQKSLPESVA